MEIKNSKTISRINWDDALEVKGALVMHESDINFSYASVRLRDDYDMVSFAVCNSWRSLEYASSRLKNDVKIIKQAMVGSVFALKFVHENQRSNKKLFLEAVMRNGEVLAYASEDLKDDEQLVIEAIRRNARPLSYASERLRSEPKFILKALKYNKLSTLYCSEQLKIEILKIQEQKKCTTVQALKYLVKKNEALQELNYLNEQIKKIKITPDNHSVDDSNCHSCDNKNIIKNSSQEHNSKPKKLFNKAL